MKEMLSCLPNALTTPAAETEIVPRLNKVYDIFGNEGRVWDLVRRTRLVLAHCHNIRYEFKTRGSSCADVDVLEGILSVVEIFTSIMPEGFDVWPFVQELAQIYDIFNTSEEDLRTTLTRVRSLPSRWWKSSRCFTMSTNILIYLTHATRPCIGSLCIGAFLFTHFLAFFLSQIPFNAICIQPNQV